MDNQIDKNDYEEKEYYEALFDLVKKFPLKDARIWFPEPVDYRPGNLESVNYQ